MPTAFPKSVNFSQALKTVQNTAIKLSLSVESIAMKDAVGRVLSSNVVSPIDVPEYDCSRMDGYAINYDYFNSLGNGARLQLNPPVYAGINNEKQPVNMTRELAATPVMTGSLLPPATDVVVMKEHATMDGDLLKVDQVVFKRQNIRLAGSDIKKGQQILKKNHGITAADLGVLSSLGLNRIDVFIKPKVALLMTGDELVPPGNPCAKGQVYDSNSLMLTQMLKQLGCEVTLFNTLLDNKKMIDEQFKLLINSDFDLVVTVGGVSMGDKDWLPEALLSHGNVLFHKTRIKPGFPLLFGTLGKSMFFGLPGNPVSAFTTFFQFIYPALLCANQCSQQAPMVWRAELLGDYAKSHMKREFVRGHYNMTASGGIEVIVCGSQQSSRVQSIAEANCLIVFNESQQDVKQGEKVSIQPFSQLCHLGE